MGVIETLIVWENLRVNHYVLKNAISKGIVIKHLNKDEEIDQSKWVYFLASFLLSVLELLYYVDGKLKRSKLYIYSKVYSFYKLEC